MADKDLKHEENVRRRAERTANEPERPVANRRADHADEISDTPLSMTTIRNKALHGTGTKIVLGLLIFIFAIAGALLSGGGMQGGDGEPVRRNTSEAVATVGSDTVERGRFENMLSQQISMQSQFGQNVGPIEYFGQAQQSLTSMANELATQQAAAAAGIAPTDADVDKEIKRLTDEQVTQQKGSDDAAFRRMVESKYPDGEAGMRAEIVSNFDRELVRKSLLSKQLEEKVKADNKVSEDDYKKSVTKLQLRQIVIRPELPGPKATDFKKAQEENTAKAVKKAEALAATLKGKSGAPLAAAFANAARSESADIATKNKGGVVGLKLPTELPISSPAVRDALQNATGNLVGPVADDVSKDVYLFLIEGRKLELPKDYAKKKTETLKNFETQRDNDAWQKKKDEIAKATKPDIADPALAAYKIQTEQVFAAPTEAEKNTLRQDALAKYESALGSAAPLEASAIRYQMAQIYRDLKQPEKMLPLLQQAVKDQPSPQVMLELARAQRDDKKKAEAIATLKEVSKSLDDSPSPPSPFGGGNPDDSIRFQVATELGLLGETKAADAERRKVKPPEQSPMGAMPGMPGGNSPIQIQPGR